MRSALKENFENYLLNIRLQLFFKKFLMQKVVVIRVMVWQYNGRVKGVVVPIKGRCVFFGHNGRLYIYNVIFTR